MPVDLDDLIDAVAVLRGKGHDVAGATLQYDVGDGWAVWFYREEHGADGIVQVPITGSVDGYTDLGLAVRAAVALAEDIDAAADGMA